jgi:hypothetical protein
LFWLFPRDAQFVTTDVRLRPYLLLQWWGVRYLDRRLTMGKTRKKTNTEIQNEEIERRRKKAHQDMMDSPVQGYRPFMDTIDKEVITPKFIKKKNNRKGWGE